MFDLTIDPYELKNLAADSARRASLTSELDAQIKATGYIVPADMDQPGTSSGKAAKKKNKTK